jgi:hypothetical protein
MRSPGGKPCAFSGFPLNRVGESEEFVRLVDRKLGYCPGTSLVK